MVLKINFQSFEGGRFTQVLLYLQIITSILSIYNFNIVSNQKEEIFSVQRVKHCFMVYHTYRFFFSVMAFVTYVLVSGIVLGVQNRYASRYILKEGE